MCSGEPVAELPQSHSKAVKIAKFKKPVLVEKTVRPILHIIRHLMQMFEHQSKSRVAELMKILNHLHQVCEDVHSMSDSCLISQTVKGKLVSVGLWPWV